MMGCLKTKSDLSRFFNHPQMTWTMTTANEEPMEIFGFAKLHFDAFEVVNDTEGHLAVKLCDIFPDGSARLLTIGVQNLCEIHSLDHRGFGSNHIKLQMGKR